MNDTTSRCEANTTTGPWALRALTALVLAFGLAAVAGAPARAEIPHEVVMRPVGDDDGRSSASSGRMLARNRSQAMTGPGATRLISASRSGDEASSRRSHRVFAYAAAELAAIPDSRLHKDVYRSHMIQRRSISLTNTALLPVGLRAQRR